MRGTQDGWRGSAIQRVPRARVARIAARVVAAAATAAGDDADRADGDTAGGRFADREAEAHDGEPEAQRHEKSDAHQDHSG